MMTISIGIILTSQMILMLMTIVSLVFVDPEIDFCGQCKCILIIDFFGFVLHFLFADYDDYFNWDNPNKPNDPYADDNCKF
jgi:hypothetical protein